jgi:hypothetical protein
MRVSEIVAQEIVAQQIDSGWEFVNNKVILVPALYTGEFCNNATGNFWWRRWYKLLKMMAYYNQEETCECGDRLYDWQCHHTVITQEEARGVPQPRRSKILNHSYNVMLLHPECHYRLQSKKSQAIEFLASVYDLSSIEGWYEMIDMKTLMPFNSLLS